MSYVDAVIQRVDGMLDEDETLWDMLSYVTVEYLRSEGISVPTAITERYPTRDEIVRFILAKAKE